jgi:asparagine synthase (glutamine-hydrolysing)
MCGIAGVLNSVSRSVSRSSILDETLWRMLDTIQHRGPDSRGIYRDEHAGLGSVRLSIIDLAGGDQPISNEDDTLWIVFNGEIFNFLELREQLERQGHRFRTHSDTEVILHLYEEHGPACLNRLNGQFAIALWDAARHTLLLARDRLGVRPLFYGQHDGRLIFGSEVKAILACPAMEARIDPLALRQVFTYWSVLPPRTIFSGIKELPPGHYLTACPGEEPGAPVPYWGLHFEEPATARDAQEYAAELEDLLLDATRIRLRADVPVGAYLSGGLDSSLVTAMARAVAGRRLETFSVAFGDNAEFDESGFQRRMAEHLGTTHHVVACTAADIGRVFPQVIWHAETPLLRTAPAPMYLLSGLAHDQGFKVVLTGEGADEFLAGYDIFKEMKIRRFWAREPESRLRPLLLRRLYNDMQGTGQAGDAYRVAFFKQRLGETDSPVYSHAIRWANTARLLRFLSDGAAPARTAWGEDLGELPAGFGGWSPVAQAQYLEITTFLSPYLLSSQGDRMAMAHAVEGRYPFLDHRLVEFCNRLPAGVKLSGLTEKWLLKQVGRKWVPGEIWRRPKKPYRAPIQDCFLGPARPEYVPELLCERALRNSGLFNPTAVGQLLLRAEGGRRLSHTDEMALVGILSAQLVHSLFVSKN